MYNSNNNHNNNNDKTNCTLIFMSIYFSLVFSFPIQSRARVLLPEYLQFVAYLCIFCLSVLACVLIVDFYVFIIINCGFLLPAYSYFTEFSFSSFLLLHLASTLRIHIRFDQCCIFIIFSFLNKFLIPLLHSLLLGIRMQLLGLTLTVHYCD